MAATDGPNYLLKGIKIINYDVIVEPAAGGNGCNVDQNNLNTSIEFVANQSTNLKIVSSSQHAHRSDELMEQAKALHLSADKEAADKAFHDYNYMPKFYIDIMQFQTAQFTCAGSVDAQLLAYVEELGHIIPTQAPLTPQVEIWSTKFGFVSPQQAFSNNAIDLSGQIMKKLVNDWAASQ